MHLESIGGRRGQNEFCPGFRFKIDCNDGFIFPDGSTTNRTSCVLMDGVAKWSFVQSCYPRNYLNINIKQGSQMA